MDYLSQLPALQGIIDTHAHYDDDAFSDVDQLLPAMHAYGVSKIITSGTGKTTCRRAIELAEQYDFVYASVGIHPELADENDGPLDWLEQHLNHEKVVALGEIGLDYHYRDDNKALQKDLFYRQLQLAMKHNMPVVVHDREAHADTLELLQAVQPRGTVHCYSGSVEMARELVKLGMHLGIGGVVTFQNAKKLVEVVAEIPLEHMVLETDAPYLAPTPFRGKRNHSAFISLVAQRIAEIKNVSASDVLRTTSQNAIDLYHLK